MWPVFKIAGRAAVWRRTPNPRLVGLPTLLGWVIVLAFVRGGLQLVEAGPTPLFNPYGLNSVVAWIATALTITALFLPAQARVTALAAVVALSILTEVALAAFGSAWPLIQSTLALDEHAAGYPALIAFWTTTGAPLASFAVPVAFWIGAMFAVLRSFEVAAPVRVFGKVLALWAALFVAKNGLPHAPVFAGPDYDVRQANLWEVARAPQPADTSSAVTSNKDTGNIGQKQQLASVGPLTLGEAPLDAPQPAPVRTALGELAPQRPGVTDVYTVGLAGWSEQDVFRKELDGALTVMGRVLPLKDRTIRLSNDPDASLPLADHKNFAAAIHAVAQVMDKTEDVLLLLMTSHGATNGVALQLPGKQVAVLTPQEVATILANEGIKHRLVIVSACYAGVFVKPLADDDSIVLTAADDKNTSFGCAPGRDWTYFGDALFNQSLQPGVDLKFAFSRARLMIAGWEQMDRVTPSNPQGHFGSALLEKLAPVFEAMQTASR
jgi:hypothetical protein